MKNPILESLRETRERLLAESGGTLTGLVERLQAAERVSGRTVLRTTQDWERWRQGQVIDANPKHQ